MLFQTCTGKRTQTHLKPTDLLVIFVIVINVDSFFLHDNTIILFVLASAPLPLRPTLIGNRLGARAGIKLVKGFDETLSLEEICTGIFCMDKSQLRCDGEARTFSGSHPVVCI